MKLCEFCKRNPARKKYCSHTCSNRAYHANVRGKEGNNYSHEASEERLRRRQERARARTNGVPLFAAGYARAERKPHYSDIKIHIDEIVQPDLPLGMDLTITKESAIELYEVLSAQLGK